MHWQIIIQRQYLLFAFDMYMNPARNQKCVNIFFYQNTQLQTGVYSRIYSMKTGGGELFMTQLQFYQHPSANGNLYYLQVSRKCHADLIKKNIHQNFFLSCPYNMHQSRR